MNHTFEMQLFGLTVEISGEAWKGESASIDCPRSEPEFEINSIEHELATIEIDDLSDSMLKHIERAALKAMKG